MSKIETDYPETLHKVFGRVGRNVVFIQQLEQTLKLLLALIESGSRLDALSDEHAKFSRNTLGQLLGSFRDLFSIEDREFGDMLDQLVKERNVLVHHFHQRFGHLLTSPWGTCRSNCETG
jgi:hypothetical protein